MRHSNGTGDGIMMINMTGYSGASTIASSSPGTENPLASGGSVDTSSGIAGFRLDGNIDPVSVDKISDRAGAYSGTLNIPTTTL
jgi:hypothetical protein